MHPINWTGETFIIKTVLNLEQAAQAEKKSWDEVKQITRSMNAVVISTSTMTFLEDADLLASIKEESPETKCVIFGSHPTFMPKYAIANSAVDIAVRYEPEFILRDLFHALRSGEHWQNIPGIAYKSEDGIQINPKYPFMDNLDELPFPDVTLLPKDIDYYNPIIRRMPYMATSTSKGCPAKCRFCTAPWFDGLHVRFQTADYIVREIEYFLEHGYREVYFRDDTFFVHKKRERELCNQIIQRKIDVSWIANARIDMIDKELMELAKRAGCHTIKFGVESGVQEILDGVNKNYQIEQAYQVFKWAHEVGINTHAHAMLGMPGDTLETVDKTIQYVKELDPTTATFGICTPYPGSPLFEEVSQAFPEIKDGTSSDLSKLHIEGIFNEHYTTMTQTELNGCVRKAYREFYLRPSFLLKSVKNQINGIDDLKRVSIAAGNVIDFALFGGT